MSQKRAIWPRGSFKKFWMLQDIPRVSEEVARDEASLDRLAKQIRFPLVMKVVGPVHKSDVGGVALGIDNDD